MRRGPVGSEDVKSTALWSTSSPMWYAADVIVGSRAPAIASSPEQLPTSPSHKVPRQTSRHVRPFDWQPTVARVSVRLIQNVAGSLRSAQPVTAQRTVCGEAAAVAITTIRRDSTLNDSRTAVEWESNGVDSKSNR